MDRHNSEYKQSPYGLDTRTSILLYLLGRIGALANELTKKNKNNKKKLFPLFFFQTNK